VPLEAYHHHNSGTNLDLVAASAQLKEVVGGKRAPVQAEVLIRDVKLATRTKMKRVKQAHAKIPGAT